MREKGIAREDYWKKFAQNPTASFVPPVWEENFTRNELIGLLETAYKSFYLRPSYILGKIFRVRSLKTLRSYMKAGTKLIRS